MVTHQTNKPMIEIFSKDDRLASGVPLHVDLALIVHPELSSNLVIKPYLSNSFDRFGFLIHRCFSGHSCFFTESDLMNNVLLLGVIRNDLLSFEWKLRSVGLQMSFETRVSWHV